jgi:hypothetical protein
MSTASPMEQSSSRIDLGQRLFVMSIFMVAVAEALITIMNIGGAFDWLGCLFGIVAGAGILYLGNWLYTGSKTALNATAGWAAVFFLLAALGLMAKEFGIAGDAGWDAQAHHLGIAMVWQAWIKLAVYALLLSLLVFPTATRDWLAHRRGESIQAIAAAVPAAPGADVPVVLAAEHTNALEAWSSALGIAIGAMFVVGLVLIVIGGSTFSAGETLLISDPANDGSKAFRNGLLGFNRIAEGVFLMALAGSLSALGKAINRVTDGSPRTMGPVMQLFAQLNTVLMLLLVLSLLLISITLMVN